MNQESDLVNYLRETPNFLALFLSMVFIILPSVLLLDISNSTGIFVEDLSRIFAYFLIGNTIGILTSELIIKKFNKLCIIILFYIAIIICLVVFLYIPGILYIFSILFFIIGFFSGTIFIQANKSLFENEIKNKDKLVNIAFGFQALGAFTTPFVASALVNIGRGWKPAFYFLIIMIFITIIAYFTITKSRIKKEKRKVEQKNSPGLMSIFIDRKKNYFFIITIISIISYYISETILLTWSPTFFRVERLFDFQSAGIIISIFWAAVGIGRVVTSILSDKIPGPYIMIALSMLAAGSMSFAFLCDLKYVIFIAFFLIGLGCSSIPTLLFSSGGILYKKGRGVLTTMIFTAGSSGMFIAPLLVKPALENGYIFSIFLSVIFMGVTFLILLIRLIFKKRYFR